MSVEWSNWHDRRKWEQSLRRVANAEAACQPLLRDFVDWSRVECGLRPSTMQCAVAYVGRFLSWIARGGEPAAALRRLTAHRVESFFVEVWGKSGYGTRRGLRTAVCRFLRYTGSCGWSDPRLVAAVPGLRTYRLAHVVRGIGDDQIRMLRASLPVATPADVRDRAILVMLAVYGARSGQLGSLRLADVRWKEAQILLPAHKGGKPVLHALVPQVARLLARYIREFRPDVAFQEIFLTTRRPYIPLSASATSTMVRSRLTRAGIETTAKGAHIFRHAFASRLLRQGHSLKTVADLLGHRDFGSVAVYTKVEESALRQVAAEWPEAEQ
jgi:integrase/recombinase XerD